jgi:transcriptional regulator with PAS, ATPase and Fis domain
MTPRATKPPELFETTGRLDPAHLVTKANPAMLRVTLTDLSRLPPERLAKLLLEWAARDRTLLSRLHGTIAEAAPADGANPEIPPAPSEAHGDLARPVALVGNSPEMLQLADMIERFAKTDEPVLISGESGTGKELAARAIHQRSGRASAAFVAVNCAAIPPNLIASELFGYEKGAFTGAMGRTKGQVEHANGGTLFLDEVGDMPLELQGYLLRFLQEGQIMRVGGRQPVAVDVRIVSATNVRLRQAIAENRFREDLFYRLNVLALDIPPLRRRPDDIALLANHFLREAAREFGRDVTVFEPAAMTVLRTYHWPGNVRELMSTVRRAVVIGASQVVAAADLIGLDAPPPAAAVIQTAMTVSATRPPPGSAEERDLLLSVLAGTRENIALTARELGVSRVTLYRMLRRHGIVPSRGFNAAPGAVEAELDGASPHAHSDASQA